MKFTSKRFKKPTLLSVAVYIFMLTLVAKGFFLFANQHPSKEKLLYAQGIVREARLGGDGKSTSFLIESDKGTYRYIPACEDDNIPCRARTLRTEQNRLWFENTRTVDRPISMRDTAPTTSACLLRMPGSRPLPRLLKVHQLFVFHAFLQDVLRCVPGAILYFAEIPGVTFSAGKIAPRLVYGKIIFRP
jgi:hypothetical protein